jgi:HAMP domain-containing protein
VPLIDPRTGLIDRAWYLFFLSLNDAATAVVDDSGLTFSAESTIASLEAALDAVRQELQTLPPAVDYTEDILKLRKEHNIQPSAEVGELQQQINTLRQEIQTQRQPELGTFAALQQDNLPWTIFDTTPESVPTTTGTVAWAGGTTLGIQMTANVLQRVGESQYFYIKADSTITKGQLIMFTGAVGASGVIKGAPATGLTDGQYLMGVAAENIAANGFGLVTSFGNVRGWNTTGSPVGETWVDGDILYYNPSIAGGLTKTQPTAPNVKATIAVVVNAAPAGSGDVFVRVSTGSVLGGTDSNVQFGTLATNDLIQYNGTIWTNVTPASVINSAGGAPVTKTANFSVAAGETWLINNKSGSSCTVTLPTPSTNTGRVLHFQNYQAQTLVSASSNVVPLAGGSATTAILEAVAGANATLVSDGTSWIMTQYDSNNALQLE